MINAGAVLAQILRIIVGFILAVIAGGLFLAYGFFQGLDAHTDPLTLGATVGAGLVWASILGGMAFVPALAAVVLSEVFRLRGIVFHLAAGGVIAFGLWTLGQAPQPHDAGLAPGSVVAVAAGFIAAFAYWIVAGRQAGCWRNDRLTPDT